MWFDIFLCFYVSWPAFECFREVSIFNSGHTLLYSNLAYDFRICSIACSHGVLMLFACFVFIRRLSSADRLAFIRPSYQVLRTRSTRYGTNKQLTWRIVDGMCGTKSSLPDCWWCQSWRARVSSICCPFRRERAGLAGYKCYKKQKMSPILPNKRDLALKCLNQIFNKFEKILYGIR